MTNAFRPFLWVLLAAALFVRAFVPQGYMPERAADSTITVAICGSEGHWAIPAGKSAPAPEEARADPPCAFAGIGTPALPPGPALEVPTLALGAAHYPGPSRIVGAVGAEVLLPPVRGPPPTA